jgi:hypothetical protein
MSKPFSAFLIIAVLTVGMVLAYFITSGMTVEVRGNVDLRIGVDHAPAPTINYNIKKEGVWGV